MSFNRFLRPSNQSETIRDVAAGPQEENMKTILASFFSDVSGATAIEYGLIAGLISVVIITAVTKVGTSVSKKFNTIATSLT